MTHEILLVNPPLLGVPFVYPGEHLGLEYLASFMRNNGYSVKIIDAQIYNLGIEDLLSEICNFINDNNPLIVGFSVTQPTFNVTSRIVQKIKNNYKDLQIVVGGKFPTLTHTEILKEEPCIDIVVRGDGEFTLLELVRAIERNKDLNEIRGITYRNKNKGIKINPSRPAIYDLDALPFPARDTLSNLLDMGFLAVNVLSSRGCYGNCKFCTISALAEKWRGRSPENVLEELKYLYDKWNVQLIHFTDSNFIGPGHKGRERAYQIASLIIKEGLDINFSFNCRVNDVNYNLFKYLKRAGLIHVFIGTESANQRILDIYNKGCTVKDNINTILLLKELGINVTQGFIMFDPFITFDEIKLNVKFLEETGGWEIDKLINKLWLTPNTQIVKELEKHGRINKTSVFEGDFEIYDEKVKKLFEIMHVRYYSSIQPILEDLQRLKYISYYQKRNDFHVIKTLDEKMKRNAINLFKECICLLEEDKFYILSSILKKYISEADNIHSALDKIKNGIEFKGEESL